ncbi:MAG: ROK family protein, partial [Microlunatus sp.]|nr:ROK family protein [Microlunatus sp.]
MTSTTRSTPAATGRTLPRSGRVDQAQMRAANMGLILRHLRTHGGRSRARLAAETGLSKATMSSLIGDLADRGLVREGALDRDGSVGRPGLTVTLDGRRVCGIGVELNVDYIALTAVDLTGAVIRESTTPIAVRGAPVDEVLDRVAAMATRALASVREAGLSVVALTVAPPGVIDYDAGEVRFAPNLGWRGVSIVAELISRLGPETPPIHLENDAKLAALAEYSGYAPEGILDLLYLTGDVGVGAGIIAGGELIRGWSGFSGEVGHLS